MEGFGSSNQGRTLDHVEPIVPDLNHTVLYDLQSLNSYEPPKPYEGRNLNNGLNFVNLPSLRSNAHSIRMDRGGGYLNRPLWPLIQESLKNEIKDIYDLEEVISRYNDDIVQFKALRTYCQQRDNDKFFQKTLPAIINLALQLPHLIKTGIPLLKHGQKHSISLSQQQIACLLANAFLCTFPDKRSKEKSGHSFPDINFNRLFQSERHRVVEKIKCIVNYFERVTKKMPVGVLTFIRRSIGRDNLPDWATYNIPLSKTALYIKPNGTIEDEGFGLLQVDFANKYIGGGVLGGGCVQEEIRFIICPELIISRLFTEFLKDNEALVIAGAEQFSNYKGYADSFEFAGSHQDNTAFEKDNNRRRCYIVAIDALNFSNPNDQYQDRFIKRELNKAYVGFYNPLRDVMPPGVASGNWGCGAFKGDPQLKSLIQLMACTVTKRSLTYFTFGNTSLSNSLIDIYQYLKTNNVNTFQLWKYMNEYRFQQRFNEDLFTFIKRRHHDGEDSPFSNKETDEISWSDYKYKDEETSTKSKQAKSSTSNSENMQIPQEDLLKLYSPTVKNEASYNNRGDQRSELNAKFKQEKYSPTFNNINSQRIEGDQTNGDESRLKANIDYKSTYTNISYGQENINTEKNLIELCPDNIEKLFKKEKYERAQANTSESTWNANRNYKTSNIVKPITSYGQENITTERHLIGYYPDNREKSVKTEKHERIENTENQKTSHENNLDQDVHMREVKKENFESTCKSFNKQRIGWNVPTEVEETTAKNFPKQESIAKVHKKIDEQQCNRKVKSTQPTSLSGVFQEPNVDQFSTTYEKDYNIDPTRNQNNFNQPKAPTNSSTYFPNHVNNNNYKVNKPPTANMKVELNISKQKKQASIRMFFGTQTPNYPK